MSVSFFSVLLCQVVTLIASDGCTEGPHVAKDGRWVPIPGDVVERLRTGADAAAYAKAFSRLSHLGADITRIERIRVLQESTGRVVRIVRRSMQCGCVQVTQGDGWRTTHRCPGA